MSAVERLLRPEPSRDRYGRYLLRRQGETKATPYTRVTTFADALDDRYNLERWKCRQVALGLVARADLHALAASVHPDDKKRLDSICDDAIEAAKASSKANVGTAIHSWTEQVDRGETPVIPTPWDADIAAYRRALGDAGVEIIDDAIERIVLIGELGLAGTFDRLVRWDNRIVVADVKTGQVDYAMGSIAVQLACYAHADGIYDPAVDAVVDMPWTIDTTTALVLHVPAGTGEARVLAVDIEAGWDAALVARQVRAWRTRKNLASQVKALTVDAKQVPLPASLPVTAGAVSRAAVVAAAPAPVASPAVDDRDDW